MIRNGHRLFWRLCMVALLLLAPSAWARKPTITLAIAETAPPKMFLRDGQPSGYIFEIARTALQRAGYQVEVVTVPWPRAVALAQEGKAVVPSLSFTAERAKVFHFTTPMWHDRVVLVTRANTVFPYSKPEDLLGQRVGIGSGAEFGEAFARVRANLTVETDPSNEIRLRKLAAGRIDVAVLGGGPAAVVLAANQAGVALTEVAILPVSLSTDSNHIGISKTRPDGLELLAQLNRVLADMWEDGSIAALAHPYEQTSHQGQ